MALDLKKGQGLSLLKENGKPLQNIAVAIGWSKPRFPGKGKYDMDLSIFGCGTSKNADGWPQIVSEDYVAFYNQQKLPSGAVNLSGDDREGGSGEGDNETALVHLDKFEPAVVTIPIVATLFEAKQKGQKFGDLDAAYIRIMDMDDNGRETHRYTMTEGEASQATALLFAELYREATGFKIKIIAEGFEEGLDAFFRQYGVGIRGE